MASSIPTQSRAVDPYASYNSNVVNQLTGIVTRGADVLDYYNSLQVIPDSTSAIDHVVVLPGIVYKDDMLIDITSQHTVDFTDITQYVSASGDPFNVEDGIYYIVLEYTYVKSRPAPQARVKILLPSQRGGSFTSLFFLKAVDVEVSGGSGSIVAMYDYDPDDPTVRREYVKTYAGGEVILPTHNQARDQARIAYDPTTDEFNFGYSDRWAPASGIGASALQADTSTFQVGDLVYVNSSGTLSLAVSTAPATTADGVVTIVDTNGLVQTVGRVTGVGIESGATVTVGGIVYLSTAEAGTVTNQTTSQFVGKCIASDGTSIVSILFHRGEPTGAVAVILLAAGWIFDGGSSLYYQDVDITSFGSSNVILEIYDRDTLLKISPSDIDFSVAGTARIWMTANTYNLNVTVIG